MGIEPLPNETQPEHFDRCFPLVQGNTDQKTAACLAAWRDAHPFAGAPGPADDFVRLTDKPVFVEHDRPRGEGVVDRYGKAQLVAMIGKLNDRIEDTNDYVAISDGHTFDDEDLAKGAKDPDVLGWAGPFRLGMIGNKRPRYAIICDEWHYKSEADSLRRKPRRSVELWLHDRLDERFFDPIAALGSSTPKLDTGLKYSKATGGLVPIDRYSAMAFAGGSNTFIPSTPPTDKKERFEKMALQLTPEDVDAVAKRVVQMLAEMPDPDAQTPPANPAPPANPTPPPANPTPTPTPTPVDDDEKEKDRMSKKGEKDRYSKLEAEIEELKAERNKAIRREKYSKLAAEGFVFNEDEELKLTANYTPEQFETHEKLIRANYSRRSPSYRLPVPGAAEVDPAKANRDAAFEARARVERYRKEGKRADYKTELAAVKKERGLPA